MPIETKSSSNNDVFVISVKGAFDFSMLEEFRNAYSKNIDLDDSARVVIDMRETSSINSSALGMLLNMQRYLNKKDREIEIINMNHIVKRVLDITQFNSKFKIE